MKPVIPSTSPSGLAQRVLTWMDRLPVKLAAWALTAAAPWIAALSLAAALPAGARTWLPIGPDRGTVLSLAHQPGAPAVMLAGTYFGGLYRSVDWGYNWVPVAVPFSAASVFALQWDPMLPDRVYAGLFQERLWRSDDAGQSWIPVGAGMSDVTVQSLSVDPTSSQRLLVATPTGVYRSTDGAITWTKVPSLAGLSTRAVIHDPARPGVVYVGTIGNGVWRSTNGGASFVSLPAAEAQRRVSTLAIDAAGRLFAGSDVGVFMLRADAGGWTDLRFNLPKDTPVEQVLVHPAAPDILVAATPVGTYVISDWQSRPEWYLWSIEGSRALAVDTQGLQVHVALQIGGVRATVDFGLSFVRADHGIQTSFVGGLGSGLFGGEWQLLAGTELGVSTLRWADRWRDSLALQETVFDIHVRDGTAYAGSEANGVYKSTDGGQSWTSASRGLTPPQVRSLAFMAEREPALLATSGAGLHRSVDAGLSWKPVRVDQLSYATVVSADPVRPPIVWIAGGSGRVFRSIDSGRSFLPADTGLPDEEIVQLVHWPWTGVHALTATGRLFTTRNDGSGWFPAAAPCTDAPARALQLDPVRGWILYLATAGGGVCKSESAGLSWRSINDGLGELALSALHIDAADGKRLWTGGVGKVWRTTDAGTTWQASESGLPSAAPVTQLLLDPHGSGRLWAVAFGQGLFQSDDGGRRWEAVSSGGVAAQTMALVADPTVPGRLLAGTQLRGVQRSLDAGRVWVESSEGLSLFVRSVKSDPADAATLYASTFAGSVFRSRDAAATWQRVGTSSGNAFRLRSPEPNRVLVGTSNGVGETLDGGETWADLGQRLGFVLSILVDPAAPSRVLIGGPGGELWVGEGGGRRWLRVGAALPRRDVLALTACPDGSVYAAPERGGLWRSRFDTLDTWTSTGAAGLGSVKVVALACDPRSGFLYAASNGDSVWLSLDRGANWSRIDRGLFGNVMSAVLSSPIDDWEVWAAVGDGLVYRSGDAGLTWTPAAANLPPGGVSHLVAGADGTLYAGTQAGVFRRNRGASGWVAATPVAAPLQALWADPRLGGTLLAAFGSAVWRSGDAGATWQPVAMAPGTSPILGFAGVGNGDRLYAATAGTGIVWREGAAGPFGAGQPPASAPLVVLDIAFDAAGPGTIYLASGGQGFLVSRDGGAHWSLANAGLPSLELLAVAAHPTRAGEVYVGTRQGVFASLDHGSTWSAVNEGLVNRNATALHFDVLLADTLYVGLEGGGVWYLNTRR